MSTLKIFLAALVALIAIGCSTSTEPTAPPPTVEKTLVNSGSDLGYLVEIYSDAEINVGYNRLYFRVLRSNKVLDDAHLTVVPDMDMGMMHHSCPVEQPTDSIPDEEGLYHASVIFTMSSSTAWKIGVTIHDHATDSTVTVHVPVTVASSGNVQIVTDAENTKYVLTLLSDAWMVGMNDVKFNVYRTTDGFDYTPVNDASLKMVPTMPSMGHGSMGNVHPSSTGNGWYTGRANFTMTGDWQLDLTATTIDAQSLNAKYQIIVR